MGTDAYRRRPGGQMETTRTPKKKGLLYLDYCNIKNEIFCIGGGKGCMASLSELTMVCKKITGNNIIKMNFWNCFIENYWSTIA